MEIINPSEIISERFNDARNLVRNAMKSSNDWKSFYGVATIAESYLRNDFEIHLHLVLSSYPHIFNIKDGNTFGGKGERRGDLCIRLQRYPSLESYFPRQTCNHPTTQDSGQDHDEAMFIGIVQFMKKKKGMVPTPVPSLVWLKSLNSCPETPIDALKEMAWDSVVPEGVVISTINSGSPRAIRESANGEGRPLKWHTGSVQQGKLPGEAIQGGTEIMSDFSNDYTPLDGEVRRTFFDTQAVLSSLSIELGSDNTIAVCFKEVICGFVQGYELALCPLDLSSWPNESAHMLYYPQGERENYS